MRTHISDRALSIAARTHLAAAAVRDQALDAASRRARQLSSDGERGAQAAEYAMLGGVSAAACGALIALLRRPETLQTVVEAVVRALSSTIRSWF